MICRKCKEEIPDGSKFCLECGAKQEIIHTPRRRGNGTGTVYKRPCGTWAAEVTLGYFFKDGIRKRKMKRKCGFKTKKEAILFLETLRIDREAPKIITMSELWESYSGSWELSKSKQVAYRIAWKKVAGEIGWRAVDSFTVDELQDLVDTSAPSFYTRKDIKSVLSNLYKIAVRDDYTDKNKADFIKLPKLITSEREIFSDDDIKALWQDFGIKKEPITAQMLTMLYTGMRPIELMNITSDNVMLDAHYMTGGAKTEKGKRRKIIIPDKLIPVIEYMLSNVGKTKKIAYYNRDWDFYETWKAKRQDLCLRETLTPYCCRHTYVTNVTKLGVSPAMLQELVGHEDYETTLMYTHLSVEDRLKEVNRL